MIGVDRILLFETWVGSKHEKEAQCPCQCNREERGREQGTKIRGKPVHEMVASNLTNIDTPIL